MDKPYHLHRQFVTVKNASQEEEAKVGVMRLEDWPGSPLIISPHISSAFLVLRVLCPSSHKTWNRLVQAASRNVQLFGLVLSSFHKFVKPEFHRPWARER